MSGLYRDIVLAIRDFKSNNSDVDDNKIAIFIGYDMFCELVRSMDLAFTGYATGDRFISVHGHKVIKCEAEILSIGLIAKEGD